MDLHLTNLTYLQLAAVGLALENPRQATGQPFLPETVPETVPETAPQPLEPALPTLEPTVEPEPTPQVVPDELDSTGAPWNAELHSAGKSKLRDGAWRLKRGAALPSDEPTPIPPDAMPEITYQTLMVNITTGIRVKQFTPAQVSALLSGYGITSTAALLDHRDRWPEINEKIEVLGNDPT